ncbi:MAG: pentapeptide repeat-containing protein [Myxococcota bacterium]|nr:pentapeptide repeat-containing protein [Myxococcota bacterium]
MTAERGEKPTPPKNAEALIRQYESGERDFCGVVLSGATLIQVDLCDVILKEADLREAKLIVANLGRSDLRDIDLRYANLIGAELTKVDLRGGDLRGANLIEADFYQADLRGVDFRGANLTSANLEQARVDSSTIWSGISWDADTKFPSGFYPTDLNRHETYKPYPVELVDALDQLTLDRYAVEKEKRPIGQALKDKIRNTTQKLNAIRPAQAGDVVANAELIDVIGSGDFGDVWEARDLTTQKKVAVKIFHASKMALSLTLHYFRRGVEAMEKLTRVSGRPESVIALQEVEPSRLAFSMPLIPKTDLRKQIKNWSLEQKLMFFRNVCEAVKFAHANRILHRDIKPENILVTDELKPILTDFDICDLLFKKTLSTQSKGSMVYASPEQLLGSNQREFSTDIYSLGRILHFLLLEKDPSFLHEKTPELSELWDQPEGLVRLIRKCTLFERGDRYQSVDELLLDLKEYERDPKTANIGIEHPTVSRGSTLLGQIKRHPMALGAGATIIAALIGFAGLIIAAKIQSNDKPATGSGQTDVPVGIPSGSSDQKAHAPFSFAVLGDSRDHNPSGVNISTVKKILDHVEVQKEVSLVVYTGDMVNGAANADDMAIQLEHWKNLIKPYQNRGMEFLVTAGNHEIDDGTAREFEPGRLGHPTPEALAHQQAMKAAFPNLPSNGPANGGFTYWRRIGDILFVMLDSFRPGYFNTVDIAWLKEVLSRKAADPRPAHIFVATHSPAFPSGGHVMNSLPNYSLDRKELAQQMVPTWPWQPGKGGPRDVDVDWRSKRDALWQVLGEADVTAFLAGHEHNLSVQRIAGVWHLVSGAMTKKLYPENRVPLGLYGGHPHSPRAGHTYWSGGDRIWGYMLITTSVPVASARIFGWTKSDPEIRLIKTVELY